MPFIAACMFCQSKVRAPDRALGSSVACPRCGSAFTLVPMDHPPADVPLVARSSSVHPVQAPDEPEAQEEQTPASAARWRIDSVGLTAFFCGSVGLLLASIPSLESLTVPLAGLGLLAGLVGTGIALGREGRGLAWTLSGAGVSLAVLLLVLFWPGVLRTIWPKPASPSEDNSRMTSVAVRKATDRQEPTAPADSPWTDARTSVVQQGDVRVRIVSVSVKPVELTNFQPPRLTRENYLHVVLRIYNIGTERRLPYRSWAELSPDQEKGRLSLRDASGRTYQPRRFDAKSEIAGRTRAAPVSPGGNVTDVLIFDPPPGPVEYVRLELSAELAGGSGTMRFQIPRSMIADR